MANIEIADHANDAELALVNEVRRAVRAMSFEPLDDRALKSVFDRSEFSVADAETEGVIRSPLVAAFHRMLLEERAPETVRDKVAELFSEVVVRQHRAIGAQHDCSR